MYFILDKDKLIFYIYDNDDNFQYGNYIIQIIEYTIYSKSLI